MPPRLAKLLAVIAAVAMVGGALYYRNRSGGSAGAVRPGPRPNPAGQLSFVCVTELSNVCDAIAKDHDIGMTVEAAGVTATVLAKADPAKPPFDAWITLAPWPQMVDAQRQAATDPVLFAATPTVVASTPLAAVMKADRFRALVVACPKKDWACVAENAGMSWASIAPRTPEAANWGTFKVGVGDPDSALGRLVFGQIIRSVAIAKGLGADPGVGDFDPHIATLRQPADSVAPQTGSDDELTQLITQPGSLSLVAATASAASRFVATAGAQSQSLQAITLSPPARADVVVSPLTSTDRAARLVKLFTDQTGRDALDKAGWAPGPPTGSNGMPAADVLAALREKTR